MIPIKPEGCEFKRITEWEPKHPARWCVLSLLWSILWTFDYKSPRGQAWEWHDHVFTCYMRIRGRFLNRGMRFFELTHEHDNFIDPMKLRAMVKRGETDDRFLVPQYEGKWKELHA